MLVLSRKLNETIVIDEHIVVKVLRLENGVVSLGIQAPKSVPVHRQEIYDAIQNQAASPPRGKPGESLPCPERKF